MLAFGSLFREIRRWTDTFTDEVPGASLLMLADLQEERGMSILDERFGDSLECRFPLFEFLKPASLPLMVLLYLCMMCALVCVVLGFAYKYSLSVYTAIYWYIFLGDKTRWNNHSYLYGLLSIILLTSSADKCLSLVAPSISNTVPRWNYLFLRLQIFLVYFYAGIKKFDADWLGGYSMRGLGYHWVWSPLR
ncbi:vitamin K-dependent gamma-carboxylase [Galendromus occidentalis]|uniref:Vitamin K-dependent gamma-carboxylase n=1 Tax=Galendromus occidentalis TaxID=34638 RepID=A0AAJ7SEJ5_9ACAR|nr:vitamin K-dependent gamma-carboxylase [Galendromus occidentalis]